MIRKLNSVCRSMMKLTRLEKWTQHLNKSNKHTMIHFHYKIEKFKEIESTVKRAPYSYRERPFFIWKIYRSVLGPTLVVFQLINFPFLLYSKHIKYCDLLLNCVLWFLYQLDPLIEFYQWYCYYVIDFTRYRVWNVNLRMWFNYIGIDLVKEQ